MAETSNEAENYILHVVVVGFHHKKGCQVEYSYPPLIEGNTVESHEVPKEWKHLPSLALPDGAHNYVKDTVYFHLPGRKDSRKTVYGVSCYRQMDAKDLKNRGADVTRSTVQKSVCVLSRLPLYGLIKAKLELITHAYFDECDFSKVELLEQTYNNMKTCISSGMVDGSSIFLGLSSRDVVLLFKHKIVLLFKLILLERRVLLYGSPVESLGGLLLSILSLYPGMLEHGLDEAVSKSSQKVSSSDVNLTGSDMDSSDGYLEISYTNKGSDSLNSLNNVQSRTSSHSVDTEPESPTIPRDDVFSQHSTSTPKNNIQTETHDEAIPTVHTYHSDKVKVKTPSRSSDITTNDMKAKSSIKCDINGVKSELSSSPKSELVFTKESSPLQDLTRITHVEAIQTESEDLSLQENVKEESSSCIPPKSDLSLSILNQAPLDRTPSIEDLDSPESISKIDREDCFSWEDDRLLLAINDEIEAKDFKSHDESKSTVDNSLKAGESSGSESLSSSQNSPGPKKRTRFKNKFSSAFGLHSKSKSKVENGEVEMKPLYEGPKLTQDCYGFPLAVFTRGTVCHPYLSLQYHDILHDITIRGFLIGATNILFKQRRNLLDAIIEVNEGKIEIQDKELQKHLHLTTADLRFGEYIVKAVTEDADKDNSFDNTEWEGGDEWIRGQFRLYLLSMLATLLQEDTKLLEDFGMVFITAWKTTNNYRYWNSIQHPSLSNIPVGHPFQGHMNMNDIKVRLAHTMQSTDRGKKINAAVVQTGKYVVETGKAVGGALNNAKSAVSSWFSSWRSEKPPTSNDKTPSNSSDDLKSLTSDNTVNIVNTNT